MIMWRIKFVPPDEHGCCISLRGVDADTEKLVCGTIITRETALQLGVELIRAAMDTDQVYFETAEPPNGAGGSR